MKSEKNYKLVWIYNGRVQEVIITGSPAICNWKKNQVKNNYRVGLLQVRSEEGLKANINWRGGNK